MNHLAIIGNIKSGKTLLARALNTHPDITCHVEPFFPFFRLCQDLYYGYSKRVCAGFDEMDDFDKSFNSLLINDTPKLAMDIRQHQEDIIEERSPLLKYIEELEPGDAQSILRSLIYRMGHSGLYSGFAEGWIERFIGPLMNNGFKVIQIIRDIRAIVASRNYSPGMSRLHDKQYPLDDLIDHWKGSFQYFKYHLGNPNYYAVCYESLVSNPETVLNGVCGFLGVDFHEDILDTGKFVNGIGEPWKQNTNFVRGSGFSTNSVDKWKEVLPERIKKEIWEKCQDELDEYPSNLYQIYKKGDIHGRNKA